MTVAMLIAWNWHRRQAAEDAVAFTERSRAEIQRVCHAGFRSIPKVQPTSCLFLGTVRARFQLSNLWPFFQ